MGATVALDAWRIPAVGDQPGCDVVGAFGGVRLDALLGLPIR